MLTSDKHKVTKLVDHELALKSDCDSDTQNKYWVKSLMIIALNVVIILEKLIIICNFLVKGLAIERMIKLDKLFFQKLFLITFIA